ncbi:MAG: glycosyltransferase [Ginsengibacter sp.]
MKIAGIVILYYPDENVIENISSYLNSLDTIYIVDNSETPSKLIVDKLKSFSNVIYLHDAENKGIAIRLNQISNLAINDGFEWLLTMDQDSSFKSGTLNKYFNCIDAFKEQENVSMFGINHVIKEDESTICNPVKVHHLITSGSILNLRLVNLIGGFDEKLFIDEVDFEYCLRSVARGFDIIQFLNIFLNHNLGQTSQHRSFKTTKLTSRNLHSHIRMYYMTRNFLYVQSKYSKIFPEEINIRKRILLNRIKNNILYNKERFKVIKNTIKGFGDFRKNRMGKLK